MKGTDNELLQKAQDILEELVNRGYGATFNTISSIKYQIDSKNK